LVKKGNKSGGGGGPMGGWGSNLTPDQASRGRKGVGENVNPASKHRGKRGFSREFHPEPGGNLWE